MSGPDICLTQPTHDNPPRYSLFKLSADLHCLETVQICYANHLSTIADSIGFTSPPIRALLGKLFGSQQEIQSADPLDFAISWSPPTLWTCWSKRVLPSYSQLKFILLSFFPFKLILLLLQYLQSLDISLRSHYLKMHCQNIANKNMKKHEVSNNIHIAIASEVYCEICSWLLIIPLCYISDWWDI